jgi:exopolysaccharide production protein ExoQ
VGSAKTGVAPMATAVRTVRPPAPHRKRAVAHTARRLLHVGERAFVIFAIWAQTGSLYGMLLWGRSTALQGVADKLRVMTLLPIFLLTIAILLGRWSTSLRTIIRNPSVILLSALAVSSYIWSEVPQLTLWRTGILFGTTAFGVYLAVRFSLRELLRLLAFAFGIIAVSSLVSALFLPGYGISVLSPGAWQGIYGNKNVLGLHAALGVLVLALVAWDPGRGRLVAALGAGLCSALVFLSRSSTALVLVLAVLPLLPLGEGMRRRSSFAIPLVALGVVLLGGVAMWALDNQGTVLGWLGRSPTLSGRTGLWLVLLEAFRHRPWLGYGYNAFWVGWGGESAEVWSAVGWDPAHAHNGFLDLALQLGAIGVLTFLAGFALALLQAFRALRRTDSGPGIWPLAYLVFFFLFNLTESPLLRYDSLFWGLYVTTVCSLLPRRPDVGWRAGASAKAIRARLSIGVRRSLARRMQSFERRVFDRSRVFDRT